MLKKNSVDQVLHALAEPTRRAIVEHLSHGPASVSDIARPFASTLAAVLQHLQVLEECGLVRSEKAGRVRTCRIESGSLDGLSEWILARGIDGERHIDRLGELLGESSPYRSSETHTAI